MPTFDYDRWAKGAAASLLASDMETSDICQGTPNPKKARRAMNELIAWLREQEKQPARKSRNDHR